MQGEGEPAGERKQVNQGPATSVNVTGSDGGGGGGGVTLPHLSFISVATPFPPGFPAPFIPSFITTRWRYNQTEGKKKERLILVGVMGNG